MSFCFYLFLILYLGAWTKDELASKDRYLREDRELLDMLAQVFQNNPNAVKRDRTQTKRDLTQTKRDLSQTYLLSRGPGALGHALYVFTSLCIYPYQTLSIFSCQSG